MNFMYKVFHGQFDDVVHSLFVRFGKGVYEDRAIIKIVNSKKVKIVSGFEYGNDLIAFVAEHCKDDKFSVKGKIYSKEDIECEHFGEREKKKGFFIGDIDKELDRKELKELYEKFKLQYMLININSDSVVLKIKQKPHNPRGSYKDNFCSATFGEDLKEKALEDFAFDLDRGSKKVLIKHSFKINDVVAPETCEGSLDLRVHGKRKGFVKRFIDDDGKLLDKETELLA